MRLLFCVNEREERETQLVVSWENALTTVVEATVVGKCKEGGKDWRLLYAEMKVQAWDSQNII